jgi:hypothetical protein
MKSRRWAGDRSGRIPNWNRRMGLFSGFGTWSLSSVLHSVQLRGSQFDILPDALIERCGKMETGRANRFPVQCEGPSIVDA